MADGADDFSHADHLPLSQSRVKLFQHGARGLAGGLGPAQADGIAVDHGLDIEPVFEYGEIGVVIAEQVADEPRVVEIDHKRVLAVRSGVMGALQGRATLARHRRSGFTGVGFHPAA